MHTLASELVNELPVWTHKYKEEEHTSKGGQQAGPGLAADIVSEIKTVTLFLQTKPLPKIRKVG